MPRLRRLFSPLDRIVTEHSDAVAIFALAVSFVLRIHEAAITYLNPDEARYFQMSLPDGIGALYQSALGAHHPALYVMLMHWLGKVSESEVVLRSVAIAAGTAFPWFVYRWLSLVWNRLAGLVALLLVAFAPHLISVGAQARSYTLAILGVFVCLYLQERAVRESSIRWMLLSSVGLCLGILSEYSVAYFATASGLCFLFRAWKLRLPRAIWLGWATGQAIGIALYGFLLVTQILPILSSPMGDVQNYGWLRGAFPSPGHNVVVFLAGGTVKQFAWVFASPPVGALMIVVFLAGVRFLWKGQSPEGRLSGRLLNVLIAIMFLLAAGASVAHLHPFGRSRHTAILGVFVAVVIAVGLERVFRRAPGMLVPVAAVMLTTWQFVAIEDQNNIWRSRHQKDQMMAAVEYIRTHIPAGSTILMDIETRDVVEFYLGRDRNGRTLLRSEQEWKSSDYRLVAFRYNFGTIGDVEEDLRRFRVAYQVPSDRDVWLLDGGWDLLRSGDSAAEAAFRANLRNFGNALWVVRVPHR